MHFSEIFSNNLETLSFKNVPFRANYVGASSGITKQGNSLPDSNLEKLATVSESAFHDLKVPPPLTRITRILLPFV